MILLMVLYIYWSRGRLHNNGFTIKTQKYHSVFAACLRWSKVFVDLKSKLLETAPRVEFF